MNAPDCYACQHRGEVPGDAHSCCHHPSVKMDSDPVGALVDVLSGKTDAAAIALNIRGDPHGIRRGWFVWPANFDPVWLKNCDGFLAKPAATKTGGAP